MDVAKLVGELAGQPPEMEIVIWCEDIGEYRVLHSVAYDATTYPVILLLVATNSFDKPQSGINYNGQTEIIYDGESDRRTTIVKRKSPSESETEGTESLSDTISGTEEARVVNSLSENSSPSV
ncbi:MAG: hypothetical protein ABSF18_07745 [Gammaproteobacteria bacterium]|jgi:hypothetical protein